MLLSMVCNTVHPGKSVLTLRIMDCPGISDLNCAKVGGQWLKGAISFKVFLDDSLGELCRLTVD
jgi:hypothetical protein